MTRRLPLLLAAIAALWWFILRPWARDWGATPDERARIMPGDDWIPNPHYNSTKAITIHARPEDIWPWLVQIGRGRGGLYSVDWLDRLFRILDAPSANEILPQYQHLDPGDIIPIGGSAGWPVLIADENHALALAGDENNTRWSWTFILEPAPSPPSAAGAPPTTRLISRNRLQIRNPLARAMVLFAVDGPAGIMTVAMLRGVRTRAELLN